VSERWLPLLQASWADLDLAKVGGLVPERSPVARFLHGLAESGYLGLGREVRSAAHVIRLLGPHRVRHALVWHAVVTVASELGDDAVHHVVMGGAAGVVAAEELGFDRAAGGVVGMAAVLGLRKLFPTRADLAVVGPALDLLRPQRQDAFLIEQQGLSPAEAAEGALAAYALPGDLVALVVPRSDEPAGAVAHLVRRMLAKGGADASRWSEVRKAQPPLAAALGCKLPGLWTGVAARDLDGSEAEQRVEDLLQRAMGMAAT